MERKGERKRKTGDELYELAWNFKLMLRMAFPDGIGIQHIERQYEEFVGKKLEFETFKSRKYLDWADLFSKNQVLKDTFYVRKNAGEQLVKIQKSNIGYTKEEIRRVIQLSCYREHRRTLETVAEEKPKPVAEEQERKFIDGSTQMEAEIPKTETKENQTQTDLGDRFGIPPPLPPRRSSTTPVPAQNVQQPAIAPPLVTTTKLNPTPLVSGNSIRPIEELYTRRSNEVTLEPMEKQSVGVQTSNHDGGYGRPPDSNKRVESEKSRAKDNNSITSTPMRPTSTSDSVLGKGANWRIPKLNLQTAAAVEINRITSGVQCTLVPLKRPPPMDDMPSSEGQPVSQKKQKTQEQGNKGVGKITSEVPDQQLTPPKQSQCQRNYFTSTPPPPGTSSVSSSSSQSDRDSGVKIIDSARSEGTLRSRFLKELDEQVETDLRNLFALSSPREATSRRGGTNTAALIPPPAPILSNWSPPSPSLDLLNLQLNESILKKFDPKLTGVKSSFLCACIGMLKGVALFDQPITDLKYNPVGYSKMGLPTSGWCAYLVQDNSPTTVGRQLRGFYLSEERNTYFLTESGWILDTHLKLPPLTLVYGEFVIRQDKRSDTYDQVFEIIDAGYLNGNDLSQLEVEKRRGQCKSFFLHYQYLTVQVKVKDFLFLCNVEKTLKEMWIREKEAAISAGMYYSTVSGVQIVKVKSGGSYKQRSVFGFSDTVRNRYLVTWPPIVDTCNFPGQNIMSQLSLRFRL